MEFVCLDPNAMVRAANVRATLDAFMLLPSLGERIVMRHRLNIRELTPDKFVHVQRWLDALKEIQENVGPNLVRDVGARIIENADFPTQFPSVESILEGLDAIYQLNHRGEVGHYRTSRQGDCIVVSCETPYPRHFELGLIEGICRNKAGRGRSYSIDFEEGRSDGDVTCVVKVSTRQRRVALNPSGVGGRRAAKGGIEWARRVLETRDQKVLPPAPAPVDFDSNSLLASLLVGSAGFVSFAYGKKQGRLPQMLVGVGLMVFPYFVSSVPLMLGIGVGLLGLLALAVWLGY